jgi:hypothetical protein
VILTGETPFDRINTPNSWIDANGSIFSINLT